MLAKCGIVMRAKYVDFNISDNKYVWKHQNMDGEIVPFSLYNWLKLTIFKFICNIAILTLSYKKNPDWNAHMKVLAGSLCRVGSKLLTCKMLRYILSSRGLNVVYLSITFYQYGTVCSWLFFYSMIEVIFILYFMISIKWAVWTLIHCSGLHQQTMVHIYDIDGLVQERHNSIANALELCLSCTNPSIWSHH